MAKSKFRRIAQTGRLTPDQVRRDQEIRRKVQAEFPPSDQGTIPGPFSESLREAIEQSSMTVYQICKQAGISQTMVSRFLSGERDLRMASADRLASVLGLKVVVG